MFLEYATKFLIIVLKDLAVAAIVLTFMSFIILLKMRDEHNAKIRRIKAIKRANRNTKI